MSTCSFSREHIGERREGRQAQHRKLSGRRPPPRLLLRLTGTFPRSLSRTHRFSFHTVTDSGPSPTSWFPTFTLPTLPSALLSTLTSSTSTGTALGSGFKWGFGQDQQKRQGGCCSTGQHQEGDLDIDDGQSGFQLAGGLNARRSANEAQKTDVRRDTVSSVDASEPTSSSSEQQSSSVRLGEEHVLPSPPPQKWDDFVSEGSA